MNGAVFLVRSEEAADRSLLTPRFDQIELG